MILTDLSYSKGVGKAELHFVSENRRPPEMLLLEGEHVPVSQVKQAIEKAIPASVLSFGEKRRNVVSVKENGLAVVLEASEDKYLEPVLGREINNAAVLKSLRYLVFALTSQESGKLLADEIVVLEGRQEGENVGMNLDVIYAGKEKLYPHDKDPEFKLIAALAEKPKSNGSSNGKHTTSIPKMLVDTEVAEGLSGPSQGKNGKHVLAEEDLEKNILDNEMVFLERFRQWFLGEKLDEIIVEENYFREVNIQSESVKAIVVNWLLSDKVDLNNEKIAELASNPTIIYKEIRKNQNVSDRDRILEQVMFTDLGDTKLGEGLGQNPALLTEANVVKVIDFAIEHPRFLFAKGLGANSVLLDEKTNKNIDGLKKWAKQNRKDKTNLFAQEILAQIKKLKSQEENEEVGGNESFLRLQERYKAEALEALRLEARSVQELRNANKLDKEPEYSLHKIVGKLEQKERLSSRELIWLYLDYREPFEDTIRKKIIDIMKSKESSNNPVALYMGRKSKFLLTPENVLSLHGWAKKNPAHLFSVGIMTNQYLPHLLEETNNLGSRKLEVVVNGKQESPKDKRPSEGVKKESKTSNGQTNFKNIATQIRTNGIDHKSSLEIAGDERKNTDPIFRKMLLQIAIENPNTKFAKIAISGMSVFSKSDIQLITEFLDSDQEIAKSKKLLDALANNRSFSI